MAGVRGVDGHIYVTGAQVRDEWPDVTPALLREWVRVGALKVVTRGEFAAALGHTGPVDDPDEPARAAGPSGHENVYRWADVSRLETQRRQRRRTRGGRPRKGT